MSISARVDDWLSSEPLSVEDIGVAGFCGIRAATEPVVTAPGAPGSRLGVGGG
jgi:hypothetical protein